MYDIEITIKNIDLKFNSSDKLFSPRNVDIGTLSMIDEVNFENESKILDLGCGYGFVGILAAKIKGIPRPTRSSSEENASIKKNIQA